MSPKSQVLITGATGHVGSCTLLHALRAGLSVRAAVRSHAKANLLLSTLGKQQHHHQLHRQLTFAIVPDITLPDAYDDAMEGITHVIHIASPLATGSRRCPHLDDDDENFIRPAVQGTLGLLEAAERSGTVRRVVITSSIVALIPVAQMEGTEPPPGPTNPVRPTDRVPFTPGPYRTEFAAYANSKIAAVAAAEDWTSRTRPAFDLVHLHPSFVLGRSELASSPGACLRGTNAVVLAALLGSRSPCGAFDGPLAGATVHVDDVARCHVAALDPRRVPGGESYILSQTSTWADAGPIAARAFPAAVERRLLLAGGGRGVDTTAMHIDASLSQDTFGIEFAGMEKQVESVVGQYLELRWRDKMMRQQRALGVAGGTKGLEVNMRRSIGA